MTSGWRSWSAALAVGLAVAFAAPTSPRAAELLIFERPGCPYCAAFDREVAPIYPLTAEGKAIPAKRVDITKAIPADLDFVKVERLTPVFVLVDNRREIGRFRGYSGDDQFWGLLSVLVARLGEQTTRSVGQADAAGVDAKAGNRVEQ